MEGTEIQLKKPISWGDETIRSITLREMKAKDLRKMSLKPSTGEFLDMVSHLSGKPPAMIDELSIEDAVKCIEVVNNFLSSSLETGKS
jgi:hypothetical protein